MQVKFLKDLLQTCVMIAVYALDLVVVIMIGIKRITLELLAGEDAVFHFEFLFALI